ncbi:tetraspanin-5 isoform X1 [Eurytemora carolleeae]|uniref:tetraspanin-5 isoform X1 n=1 Tax=Eurytemora carolleeae TaxID=1294199 RepID=UPI000C76F16C|nr:tetraspanin-5 isoform X1 [Eurytemora carolleeae]XP_023338301.1 tetraspanin-5 isoform X1 [Eurytemora carolleeae]|eukprot:XP_023338291.1 tetraspanin-5-like isoform X1 [Eurytemora affinis]
MPSAQSASAPRGGSSAPRGGGAAAQPKRRRRIRDSSEVSCCLKYVIFSFNVIFWLLGLGILAIGVWAWTEKDTFNNLSKLTNIALDPAFIFIWAGAVTFIIGFTGCVGALRENTALLAAYAIFLAILLLLEMTCGILGFIFKDWIKAQATNGFQAFIVHYRDDPDQQNLIDWIQEGWLECCGIEGPQDWDKNIYFNCSSAAVGSREACGVPFSCCKPKDEELIKNKQCGYDVRKPDYSEEVQKIINEKGCLMAGEEWLENNLLTVAGVAVGVAFLQILGICFAQNLRADIFAQKAKWG